MAPRKTTDTTTLDIAGAKIGEPAKTIVERSKASAGVPAQADFNAEREIGALRTQLEVMQKQLSAAAYAAKGGAKEAARQTQATVKLYPVSTLVAVAAIAGAFAFAVAGLRSSPTRSRYDWSVDDLRDLYDRLRDRF
jgi:hypothetical protein